MDVSEGRRFGYKIPETPANPIDLSISILINLSFANFPNATSVVNWLLCLFKMDSLKSEPWTFFLEEMGHKERCFLSQ